MSEIKILKEYAVRIDTIDRVKIDKYLKKYSKGRSALCREMKESGVVHYHLYIEASVTEDALRRGIKSMFDVNRDGHRDQYSIKDCFDFIDGIPVKYLAYMMKRGEYEFHGFSDEELDLVKVRQDEVVQDMNDKNKKTRSKDKETILQKIQRLAFNDIRRIESDGKEVWVYDRYDNISERTDEWYLSREVVAERVLNFYKDYEIQYREFQVISQIQTLCMKYVGGYVSNRLNVILERV